MRARSIIVGLLLCLLSAGCGGGTSTADPVSTSGRAGAGSLQLAMSKRTAVSSHPLAQVQQFRVVVTTADGTEYIRDVASDASSVEFTELPSDAAITITVEARNRNTQAIERGRATATIRGGVATEVTLALQQVPIFTNLSDGAVVVGSQIRPEVLATPGATVRVTQTTDAAVQADLVDLSLGRADIPVSTDGLVQVRPAPLGAGRYQLRVEDTTTGEANIVNLFVIDRPARPAPLYGLVGPAQRLAPFVTTSATAWPLTKFATKE